MNIKDDAVATIEGLLADGVTGRIVGLDTQWRVYLMQGEILAVEAPRDAGWAVRKLRNLGKLDDTQAKALLLLVSTGARAQEVLQGRVSDDEYVALFASRFEEDLFDFISTVTTTTFEEMPPLFVDNIQVGHDSSELLRRLTVRRDKIKPLLGKVETLFVSPGPTPSGKVENQAIVDMVGDGLALTDLLERTTSEKSVTLGFIIDLVSAGQLRCDAPPNKDDIKLHMFVDESVEDLDLRFFGDNQQQHGRGDGNFSVSQELLDVVDLSAIDFTDELILDANNETNTEHTNDVPIAVNEDPSHTKEADASEHIELSLETATESQPTTVPSPGSGFGAPTLTSDEIKERVQLCNEVLEKLSSAIDQESGTGSGPSCVQLLVDGAPSDTQTLFRGVSIDPSGRYDETMVIQNLMKHPPPEQRRILAKGLVDLIERSLSLSVEELPDPAVDGFLADIAGYQQRLRR